MQTRRTVVAWSCALALAAPASGQPGIIVVQPFTTATGVDLPYHMTVLQAELVAELSTLLGARYQVAGVAPETPPGSVYTLDATITGWRAGNAATRFFVGLGSGREAVDLEYRMTDGSGQTVLTGKDTIRTNYGKAMGASGALSSASKGTLVHPMAQKLAERIKGAHVR